MLSLAVGCHRHFADNNENITAQRHFLSFSLSRHEFRILYNTFVYILKIYGLSLSVLQVSRDVAGRLKRKKGLGIICLRCELYEAKGFQAYLFGRCSNKCVTMCETNRTREKQRLNRIWAVNHLHRTHFHSISRASRLHENIHIVRIYLMYIIQYTRYLYKHRELQIVCAVVVLCPMSISSAAAQSTHETHKTHRNNNNNNNGDNGNSRNGCIACFASIK